MKKKICAYVLFVVLCLAMAVSVVAAEGFADEYYRVVDLAGLLTEEENAALNEKLDEVSEQLSFDVTVATTDDLEGHSVQDYADLVYEQCKFGYGSGKDGVLLLISMEDHDWYLSTCGYGEQAFTDAGIQYLGEQITEELSEKHYEAAFRKYADLCVDFVTQARTGKPYDTSTLPKKPLAKMWIGISIVGGVVVALIVVGGMKSKMKSIRSQQTAADYQKEGSLNITDNREIYLYHTVTRTEKKKEENKDSGSTTHESPSGTSHGGGGGKF